MFMPENENEKNNSVANIVFNSMYNTIKLTLLFLVDSCLTMAACDVDTDISSERIISSTFVS